MVLTQQQPAWFAYAPPPGGGGGGGFPVTEQVITGDYEITVADLGTVLACAFLLDATVSIPGPVTWPLLSFVWLRWVGGFPGIVTVSHDLGDANIESPYGKLQLATDGAWAQLCYVGPDDGGDFWSLEGNLA